MAKKWRIYLILFISLLAVYVTLPSLCDQDKLPLWVSKILPEQKLKLGLDLQGGLHLVMGVDLEKVVTENTDRYADRIKQDLKEKNIAVQKISRFGESSQLSIKFSKLTDVDGIREIVSKYSVLVYKTSHPNELIYDITDEYKDYIRQRAVEQTIEAIRNRIDEFGVNEPSIQAQGSDRILIQLPGVKDPARAKSIIGRTARLEFKIVRSGEDSNPAKLQELISKAASAGIVYEEGKTIYSDYIKKINKYLEKDIKHDSMILFEKKLDPSTAKKTLIPYLVEKTSMVTGDHLKDAYVSFDQFNEPFVSFEFNPVGSKLFGDLTEKNVGKHLAVVLDQNIYTAPVIKEKISSAGRITLGGGRSLSEMQKEAEDIALVLRAGALPAQLIFEEERTVGPTLGRDSIEDGKLSMFLGSMLVLVFMLVYYRFSGFIADIAVLMNVMIVMAVLVLFEATLTLPGIAGIILTVGMSVDANVIIFERIREELRAGNNVKASVETGYAKALWTILDANITTAIAGFVLLQYGSGPIKGFAVTLLIGIVSSVFTAVFVSKWIFNYVLSKRTLSKLSI